MLLINTSDKNDYKFNSTCLCNVSFEKNVYNVSDFQCTLSTGLHSFVPLAFEIQLSLKSNKARHADQCSFHPQIVSVKRSDRCKILQGLVGLKGRVTMQ